MVKMGRVEAEINDLVGDVLVQGFRGDEPYVFIGPLLFDDSDELREIKLTPENAHILSEEIRKHAEFANGDSEIETGKPVKKKLRSRVVF